MNPKEGILTLEQIKDKYPPEMEFFEYRRRGELPVYFFVPVCRNEDGLPLWFGKAYYLASPQSSSKD